MGHRSPRSFANWRSRIVIRRFVMPPYRAVSAIAGCLASFLEAGLAGPRADTWTKPSCNAKRRLSLPSSERRVTAPRGRSAGFAPPVRDGQAPVATEGLEADLRAGRVLAALPLGGVDQSGAPLHERGVVSLGDDLARPAVAVHVPRQDLVEQEVVGQRVAVELPRTQLGRRRLGDGVRRDRQRLAPRLRLLVAPP